jgi:hypothetical protein
VALPVFSVDTEAEAKAIQTRFGSMQYQPHPEIPGKSWYVWTGFDGEVESLEGVSEACRKFYEERKKRNEKKVAV